jgi:thioredoxin reductase (NADPH)
MSPDLLLLLGIAGALTAAAGLPFLFRLRRLERESARRAAEARQEGLDQPATLHPIVDPDRCIGSAGCVAICPEQVLGIRHGQAVALAPAACIGHGLCERTCPTEAIRLVFGTATRGVEIPRIRENFETNVPGLYIIGELGGMGLIRNAFEQGRQCIDGIVAEGRSFPASVLDVLIVGCGPAGLSAGLHAQHRGLRYAVVERDDIGGTVRHYPRKKVVMTEPVKVPGYGKLGAQEIRKEELVALWLDVVDRAGLRVQTGETVTAIRRDADGVFRVEGEAGEYSAGRVILAIGRRGTPRKLGIPGEDSPRVAYSLLEADAFRGDRVVVVGGGDSAVEAVLALAGQPDTRAWLAYRGDRLSRVKARNRDRFDAAVAAGAVQPLWQTNLVAIGEEGVVCRDADQTTFQLPTDRVFVFIGGELPTRMLQEAGVEIETKFGTP